MKIYLILIISFAYVSSKDFNNFPLWGTDWVVMEGKNERVLNPSVSPMEPNSVILVSFIYSSKTVKLRYANLNQKDFGSTSFIYTDILEQFKTNQLIIETRQLNQDYGVDIHYQNYRDTLWSCDEAIATASANYHDFYYRVGNKEEHIQQWEQQKHLGEPRWTSEKPVCYGKRTHQAADRNKYTLCKDGMCVDPNGPTEGFATTCDNSYCYEEIPGMKFKVSNLGYWQVHLYPDVKFFCRDPETGKPLIGNGDCPPMDFKTAKQMKKKALQNRHSIEMRKYRKPYLSDSASTMVSFAFVEEPGIAKNEFIWLDSEKSGSEIPFNHYPAKMWRVETDKYSSDKALERAILLSYADTEQKYKEVSYTIRYCPGWKRQDRLNGELFFNKDPRDRNRLIRNREINTANFWYNGCPDGPRRALQNLTLTQARRFLWQPPPQCKTSDIIKARIFYRNCINYMTNRKDIQLAETRFDQANNLLAQKRESDSRKEERECPDSWLNFF